MSMSGQQGWMYAWSEKEEDKWLHCSGHMKRMYTRRMPRRSLELKFEDSAGCWETLRETGAEKKGRVVIRE